MLIRGLLVVAPSSVQERMQRLLAGAGVLADRTDVAHVWDRLAGEDFDLVVVSRGGALTDLPGGLVARIAELPDRPETIVLVDREDPQERAALLAAGIVAVLNVSVPDEILAETLRVLVQRLRDAIATRAEHPRERYGLGDFISASPVMHSFLAVARRVVGSDSSLLILGETGVGKERLARAIHAEGPRSRGPFIALNCGALPESLLESELFGHERGAFTGASRARRGYFELAHRGTIFLDEIGEMPAHLQVKLLRVLEDRRIQRVGGERPIEVDVRIVAATNRDLESEVRAKRFRQDLYYRMAVVTLTLPPVRERREDVPELVKSYLDYFNSRLGRRVSGIDPEAMGALVSYDWPGNVRELINVVEQVVLLSAGSRIGLSDLPRRIQVSPVVPVPVPSADWPADGSPFRQGRTLRLARREAMQAFERDYLTRLLSAAQGRVGEAARRAGINPRSLYDLMRRHGVRKDQFRPRRRIEPEA